MARGDNNKLRDERLCDAKCLSLFVDAVLEKTTLHDSIYAGFI